MRIMTCTCYKLQEGTLFILVIAGQYLKELDNCRTLECEAVRRLARVAQHLEVPGGEGLHCAAEDLIQLVRVEHSQASQGEDGVEPFPEDRINTRNKPRSNPPDSLHLSGNTFHQQPVGDQRDIGSQIFQAHLSQQTRPVKCDSIQKKSLPSSHDRPFSAQYWDSQAG